MFWLILSTILLILCIWAIKKGRDSDYNEDIVTIVVLSGLCFFIFFIAFICVLFSGLYVYPNLKSECAKAKSFQKRIGDIKNAKYKYKTDGVLVAGSIENIKQSSVLSDYIQNVAYKEAEYNSNLENAKAIKEDPILSFFGNGFFISDKVFKLEKL